MKILICGGGGQVGSDCTLLLSRRHEVTSPDKTNFDITDSESVLRMVSAVSPDVLLNCAAYTNVDACETEKDKAWRVNADGPGNLASATSKHGSKLVHISTDYVFNGRKIVPEPYTEDDETDPLSVYGKSKLEGERMVNKITQNYLILRTAWVYGIHGRNFLKSILRLVLRDPGKEIKVVHDQFGSPTWAYDLARQIEKLLEANVSGLYHSSAGGYCSWYELAIYFLQRMGLKHHIVPCSSSDYTTNAIRPANSILENRRLKAEGHSIMTSWQEGVNQFIDAFADRLIREMRGATV